MQQFTRVVIIYNPNSTGSAKEQATTLKRELEERNYAVPVVLLPTDHAGHAYELAYREAKTADQNGVLIISASGDGGYHEVINGALKAQSEGARPVCAVLPSGNANDHARTLHQRPLVDSIAAGDVSEIDVLKIQITDTGDDETTLYAHSYAGLGLTPAVAVELNKNQLNSFKESLIVLRTFWKLRPVVLEVGDKVSYYDSLICSIVPEMAKVLKLDTNAKPDDGQFEITTLPHNHKLALLYRLAKGVVVGLGAASRSRDFTCTTVRACPLQLDGEITKLAAGSRLTISVEPKLLRTII